jgi:hypothetical protein
MPHNPFVAGEARRFGALTALGLAMGVAIFIVAVSVDTDFAVPLIVLAGVLVAIALGYRLAAGRNRSDADHTDTVPRQPARPERPLGDTPEAHDEVNPHDLPLDHPGREAAEHQAEGLEGTTTGNEEGGAAGKGGPAEDRARRLVDPDEAHRGARDRST